ncbi:DUF1302 domain-containing protein [Aestuariibacter sp. GS-14]|uniref:DUF1302 domain-containing protein n=1 Tax=Aestuariibacter sp. GS-14 TaxID=2590670 RepID=UPI0011296B8D|nr:DUF1302 domain-containing protein [Aestuariibacter sp. GS-14]TPV61948.1 DUF1302 domain-containing protein [Aestuariibacter sp. GS-14]
MNDVWVKQNNKTLSRNALAAAVAFGLTVSAHTEATTIDTGNPDLRIRWDNTVKYSASFRVADVDPNVADASLGPQANTNDGDLNFGKGLISNRLDLLSEFDLRYKKQYGFRVSAASWYDSVYHDSNDNPAALGGALINAQSVPAGEFAEETKDLHGQYGEIMDAFVYGGFNFGRKQLNVKAGRFTQLYGESLFFGSNAVAGAMTSLDLARALSVPQSEFKEVARPTGQLAAQLQVNSKLTLAAYYQFEWRKSRLPAAGSYFAFADFVDKGGETVILGPGTIVHRTEDITADDSGQFGFQARYKINDYEVGFYAAQFHDKLPQFYVRPGINVRDGGIGDYAQVFAEDIKVYGLSVSTLVGETNIAAEMSMRQDMALVATGNTVILPGDTVSDGGDNSAFPRGDTFHFNASMITILNENSVWDAASFIGEFAFNRRLNISENADQLDPLATENASAIQFVFVPDYFQVLPGLDLQVPIGFGYGIDGRSSVNGVLFPAEHGGNASIGLKGDYNRTWRFAVNFTKYLGEAGSVIQYDTPVPTLSYKNFHGDRDFISLSVQRTF